MDFAKQILDWYEIHRRDLPWRRSGNPYHIWLSEVILQQTRVDQGMAYYLRFLKQYPTIQSLAEAPEQEVLKLWQGLGYYSRARNLHYASKQLMDDFGGVFPDRYEKISLLKGVGEYTAAAIASIAFGEAVPVVDGNVKRVICRLMGIQASGIRQYKDVKALMAEYITQDRPGDFNQAVMEFGALQCVPKNPDCESCIFKRECYAYLEEKVSDLPAREIKKNPRKRYFSYFVISPDKESIILKKRNDKDIWKNLYEFPLIESNSKLGPDNLLKEPEFISWFGNGTSISGAEKEYKHQLSHQTIYARFYAIHPGKDLNLHPDWEKIQINKLSEYPVSRLMERYLEEGDASFIIK